jgi:hypothetical protein
MSHNLEEESDSSSLVCQHGICSKLTLIVIDTFRRLSSDHVHHLTSRPPSHDNKNNSINLFKEE